jgi:hypothetical protein
MELRVESLEGSSLPPGCYVGIRVGEVLKQGRYEPQRCYHFPHVDRRRNAKIDVYQHIGSCLVAVDPETTSEHSVGLTATDPSFSGMRLKVNVSSKGDVLNKQQREERTKALKNQAKDYLCKHGIEERLSEAVKALLKEQPADPTEFLCRQLRGSDALPEPTSPQGELLPLGNAEEDERSQLRQKAYTALTQANTEGKLDQVFGDIAQAKPQQVEEPRDTSVRDPASDLQVLRQQACEVLVQASETGHLTKVLDEVEAGGKASSQQDVNAVRAQACELLMEAAAPGGKLAEVLTSVQDEQQKEERQAADAAQIERTAADAEPEPVLKLDPRLVPLPVSNMLLTGPAFVSLGCSPGLAFI